MQKLTVTTNDILKNGGGGATPWPGPVRVTEAHEPLATEPVAIKNIVIQQQPSPTVEMAPIATEEYTKIAIVGTAPSSRDLAPYNDPTWKIWSCSAGNMGKLPRVDLWVEVHNNLLWPENRYFGEPYIKWLNEQKFPVFMADKSLIERAETFPKEDCLRAFGRYFFTSSFSWMMALAILKGAKEIGLWGVDMASRDEYILQRQGGQFFIQEAVRRGIKVHLPRESDLLQPPALYGFDDSTNFLRKINVREKELKDRVAGMEQQRNELERNITYLRGALEDVDYFKSIWGGAQTHSAQGEL